MTDKSARTWLFFIILGIIVWFLWGYQRNYMAHHLPLIRQGLAAADSQGPSLLEEVGLPPGAAPVDPLTKKIFTGTRRGMWRDTSCSVVWTGSWDVPDDHPAILAWYEKRLLASGWSLYHQRIPSTLETQYWKDKWLLTLEHNVAFPQEHRARVGLRLSWDYWYQLEKTSAEYEK